MSTRLNIAILGTRGIPNAYGGFEQCAEYLSIGLYERGHEVTVYCSSAHPYQESSFRGVKLVHKHDPGGTSGQFFYDLRCILHARQHAYDVIIQLGYTSSSIWYRLWPSQSQHLVNMDGIEHLRSKYSWVVQRFLQRAERWATKGAKMLIADNPGIQTYLSDKYTDSEIRYIPYGVESKRVEPPGVKSFSDFQAIPDAFDLMICRMEPENNVDTILKAYFEHSINHPLVIVGSIDNAFGKKMMRQFRSSHIHFIGAIYDMRKLDALRNECRYYLHGHSVGGTNPSLLEAMAYSSIIIAHDNVFNRSILSNQAAYFRETQDLIPLIKQFNTSFEASDWKSVNSAKLQQHFEWSSVISLYEKACYDVLDH